MAGSLLTDLEKRKQWALRLKWFLHTRERCGMRSRDTARASLQLFLACFKNFEEAQDFLERILIAGTPLYNVLLEHMYTHGRIDENIFPWLNLHPLPKDGRGISFFDSYLDQLCPPTLAA